MLRSKASRALAAHPAPSALRGEETRPAFSASASRRSNWCPVSGLSRPSRRTTPRLAVDLQAAEAQQGTRIRTRRAAAQDGLEAGQQLARVEWLGQVVVRAQLEADDAIGVVAARGEHQAPACRCGPGCGGTPRSRRGRAGRRPAARPGRRPRPAARVRARRAEPPSTSEPLAPRYSDTMAARCLSSSIMRMRSVTRGDGSALPLRGPSAAPRGGRRSVAAAVEPVDTLDQGAAAARG